MKNTSPSHKSAGPLKVDAAQAGMKLLRFLERALADQPRSVLHKWIRTGQVRVNGKRSRAFDILGAGDEVRLPPFAKAQGRTASVPAPEDALEDAMDDGKIGALAGAIDDALSESSREKSRTLARALGPGLDLVAVENDYLVLAKAGGLPSQGGSGHADSVAGRLALAYAGSAYPPAPAHRLDRDSSGLLLAGTGFAAQKDLHALFRNGGLSKDYLVWAAGPPSFAGPALLADHLQTGRDPVVGREKVFCLPGGQSLELDGATQEELAAFFAAFAAPARSGRSKSGPASGPPPGSGPDPARTALSLALPLGLPAQAVTSGAPASRPCLLLLRLFSGRKHQIRVQLAARGHYVLGDRRYGPRSVAGQPSSWLPYWPPSQSLPPPQSPPLLLHAWRLRFAWPPVPDAAEDLLGAPDLLDAQAMREYRLLPSWPPPFMPAPSELDEAAALLDLLVRERLTAFLLNPGFL